MINNIHFSQTQYQHKNITFEGNIYKHLITPAIDTVQISSKKAKAATGIAAIVASLVANASKPDKVTFENCIKLRDSQKFDLYRENLVAWLKQNNYDEYNKDHYVDIIKEIENSENLEDLNDNLECIASRISNKYTYLMYDENLNLIDKIKKQEFSQELDDFIYKEEVKMCDKLVPILELLSKKDTDPEVSKIKQNLKKQYGVEKLYCNNDIEFVKACKEVFAILHKNRIPIPKMIIASNRVDFEGLAAKTSKGDAIIINKDNLYTENPKHLIMHEILHTTQPNSLEFRVKPIPPQMQDVADNVSDYARGNFALEVHCELYTKKLLSTLTPQEEELFNYLGGEFHK